MHVIRTVSVPPAWKARRGSNDMPIMTQKMASEPKPQDACHQNGQRAAGLEGEARLKRHADHDAENGKRAEAAGCMSSERSACRRPGRRGAAQTTCRS